MPCFARTLLPSLIVQKYGSNVKPKMSHFFALINKMHQKKRKKKKERKKKLHFDLMIEYHPKIQLSPPCLCDKVVPYYFLNFTLDNINYVPQEAVKKTHRCLMKKIIVKLLNCSKRLYIYINNETPNQPRAFSLR
jgi:hypothetical protein